MLTDKEEPMLQINSGGFATKPALVYGVRVGALSKLGR